MNARRMMAEQRQIDRALATGRSMTAQAKRLASLDTAFDEADRLLAKLDADEERRRASIAEGFATMAEARADLLASPLYDNDETASERRLSALDAARRHRSTVPQGEPRAAQKAAGQISR